MDGLIIRQAKIEDAKSILEVIQIAMDQYAKQSNIPGKLTALNENTVQIEGYIKKDYFLVCEYHKNLVACVRVSSIEKSKAQISRFCVLPTMQKLGVGKLIFEKAQEYIMHNKFKTCILYTALSNSSTVNFYTSKGFELVQTNYDRGYPRGKFLKTY